MKFRRAKKMGRSHAQEPPTEAVSIHVESASTVLDDLRGQATWEEEWMDSNPGMATATNHERKVHMLGDLLSKADGVVAFREVMELSPALRALLVSEAGATAAAAAGAAEGHANNPMVIGEEAKYLLVQEKLIMGEGQKLKRGAAATNGIGDGGGGTDTQLAARATISTREFYHHRDTLRYLLDREDNSCCADCTAKLPTWASVSAGVFLCTQCAGSHRSLGVHISKVLSVQLDDWTEEQVEFMSGMGNSMANSFLEYHVPGTWLKPSHLEPREYRDAYIKAKYQDRLFEFRGRKKPVIKPPPRVIETSATMMLGNGEMGGGGGFLGEQRVAALSQGMTEYIGFVNILLVRGRNLAPPGFGQLQYMAVLRIGGQEVRSRSARADGAPSWSEKLMLCWDGSMPLNIDVYGGKDHIGQAQISLRELLLGTREDDAHANTNTLYGGGGHASGGGGSSSCSSSTGPITANRAQQQRQHQEAQGHERAPVNDGPTYYLSSDGSASEPRTPATTPHTPLSRLTPLARDIRPSFSNLSTPSDATADRSPPVFSTPQGGEGGAPPLPSLDGGGGGRRNGSRRGNCCVSFDSRASTMTSPDGVEDGGDGRNSGDFSFVAGESFKAGGSTVGSVDAGGENELPTPGPAPRGGSSSSNSNKHAFAHPPTPSGTRVGGLFGAVCVKSPLEPTATSMEVLPGGELFVTLQDRKDGIASAGERYIGYSPGTGPGSLASSRGTSPRALSNRLGSNGGIAAVSLSSSSKSFNNMMLKLGKSKESSKDSGATSGHSQIRPAQGGVVIKLDFVRIEH